MSRFEQAENIHLLEQYVRERFLTLAANIRRERELLLNAYENHQTGMLSSTRKEEQPEKYYYSSSSSSSQNEEEIIDERLPKRKTRRQQQTNRSYPYEKSMTQAKRNKTVSSKPRYQTDTASSRIRRIERDREMKVILNKDYSAHEEIFPLPSIQIAARLGVV